MADDFATEVATPTVNAVGHGGHHKADISEYVNSAEVNLQNKLYWMIDFVAVATNKCVNFPAFITEFSDNYTSNWNEEQAYGRMDPIQLFKNTQRQISLSWTVIATSVEMGKKNLHKFEHLSSMLYPTYDLSNGVSTMAAAPLLKIKFTNLIKDRKGGDTPAALSNGLLGVVTGFNFSPNLDAGFLTDGPGVLYPKEYSVSTQFTVLHTHDLGWTDEKGTPTWRAEMGFYGEDELTGKHSTCPLKGNSPLPSKKTKSKKAQASGVDFTSQVAETEVLAGDTTSSGIDPTSNGNGGHKSAADRAMENAQARRDRAMDIKDRVHDKARARVNGAGPPPRERARRQRALAAAERGDETAAQMGLLGQLEDAGRQSDALRGRNK